MKQVFRLMDMPDKIIAFDELPKDLLEGFELFDCKMLPRYWREFIGKSKRIIKVPPDRDPFTGQMRSYEPITEEGFYVYLVDRELNADKERWAAVQDYVRRNAPKDFRLKDKLDDMALPMAKDVHSELTLEPEEVIVIPLPKIAVEEPIVEKQETFKCDRCERQFDAKQGLRMHKMKRHKEPVAA